MVKKRLLFGRPQVDLNHPRVGFNLLQRPLRKHLSLVQHGDVETQVADELHVVLDHHHGVVAGQGLDQLGRAQGFLVSEAGDGFIEQQHFRGLGHEEAMASHCFWPWEREPALTVANGVRPT